MDAFRMKQMNNIMVVTNEAAIGKTLQNAIKYCIKSKLFGIINL